MAMYVAARSVGPIRGRPDRALPDRVLYEAALSESPEIRGRVPRTRDLGVGRFKTEEQTGAAEELRLAALLRGKRVWRFPVNIKPPRRWRWARRPKGSGPDGGRLRRTGGLQSVVSRPRSPSSLPGYVSRQLPRKVGGSSPPSAAPTATLRAWAPFRASIVTCCSTTWARTLSDPGSYYGSGQSPRRPRRAGWRTPPLWGVRDSGPYLENGRC